MTKGFKVSFYKKQIKTAQELKLVAEQNIAIATRLESEAKSALELLGAKPERSPKGKLSNEQIIKLRASLTK